MNATRVCLLSVTMLYTLCLYLVVESHRICEVSWSYRYVTLTLVLLVLIFYILNFMSI